MSNETGILETAVVGKYCIIRGRDFGVFAGTVEAVEDNRVLLKDARRLWYWDGAASLSQLAAEGVTNPDGCKFTVTVDSVLLLGVIEIIPATGQAKRCIEEVKAWKR
jgi:hypothetical protein